MSFIIDPKLRSPTEIREALENHVRAQPDTRAWQDFYAAGGGQIVIDLIAALGAFDAYNASMTTRELSARSASLDSSVREHAFNRGIIEAPTSTLILDLDVQLDPGARVVVSEGDLVGRLGDYELYSLGNHDVGVDFTLRVAAGFLYEEQRPFNSQRFAQINFELGEHPYIARQLERFRAGDQEIKLRDDPGDLSQQGTDFVLRQAIPGEVRIYTGNGVLGWYDPRVPLVSYRYLAYGPSLESVKGARVQFLLANCRVVQQRVHEQPVYGISKEELRGLLMFYPIDGRISQDRDYEGIILKNFGGVLYDAYSTNTDPDQIVKLLVSPEFVPSTHLPAIQRLVDSKRGTGIRVIYDPVLPTSGRSLSLRFRVNRSDYEAYLARRTDVSAYINQRNLRFVRERTVFRSDEMAVDLTNQFGLRFYSTDDASYTIEAGEFISSFDVEINP